MGRSHACAHAVTFQSACACLLRAPGVGAPEADGQGRTGNVRGRPSGLTRQPSSQRGPPPFLKQPVLP